MMFQKLEEENCHHAVMENVSLGRQGDAKIFILIFYPPDPLKECKSSLTK